MIFGGDVHFCIISMIPCRPVLMCPMFHVIMVREVIVGFDEVYGCQLWVVYGAVGLKLYLKLIDYYLWVLIGGYA